MLGAGDISVSKRIMIPFSWKLQSRKKEIFYREVYK